MHALHVWTPATDPSSVMGIPALEGVTLKPAAWVFPPTEQAAKILVNPAYPPDYQDAIIWFPTQPQIAPIYLSLGAFGSRFCTKSTAVDSAACKPA